MPTLQVSTNASEWSGTSPTLWDDALHEVSVRKSISDQLSGAEGSDVGGLACGFSAAFSACLSAESARSRSSSWRILASIALLSEELPETGFTAKRAGRDAIGL